MHDAAGPNKDPALRLRLRMSPRPTETASEPFQMLFQRVSTNAMFWGVVSRVLTAYLDGFLWKRDMDWPRNWCKCRGRLFLWLACHIALRRPTRQNSVSQHTSGKSSYTTTQVQHPPYRSMLMVRLHSAHSLASINNYAQRGATDSCQCHPPFKRFHSIVICQ